MHNFGRNGHNTIINDRGVIPSDVIDYFIIRASPFEEENGGTFRITLQFKSANPQKLRGKPPANMFVAAGKDQRK